MFQIYYATAAVNIFRQLLLYLRNIYIPRYKPVCRMGTLICFKSITKTLFISCHSSTFN